MKELLTKLFNKKKWYETYGAQQGYRKCHRGLWWAPDEKLKVVGRGTVYANIFLIAQEMAKWDDEGRFAKEKEQARRYNET